jgi:hypothetical protein
LNHFLSSLLLTVFFLGSLWKERSKQCITIN